MVPARRDGVQGLGHRALAFLGGAGQGEEDLVEGGTADADLVDGDGGGLEPVDARPPVGSGPAGGGDTGPAAGAVEPGGVAGDAAQDATDGIEPGGVGQRHLDDVAADPGLQVPEGARGDGPAVVDDHDLIGQLVGLVEVVGGEHDVGAPGHEGPHGVPHLAAAGGVETGGRLVEEQQLGCPDQAGPQIEASALAAGIGAATPVGHLGQAQLIDDDGGRPAGPRPGGGRRAGPSSPGSRGPVMVGSTAAN